jgi:O-antigen/teichoic acid export membrane protein
MESLQVFVILAFAFGVGGISKLFNYFLMAKGAGKTIKNISVIALLISLILNIILLPKFGILGAATARLLTHLSDLILLLFFYYRHLNTKKL